MARKLAETPDITSFCKISVGSSGYPWIRGQSFKLTGST